MEGNLQILLSEEKHVSFFLFVSVDLIELIAGEVELFFLLKHHRQCMELKFRHITNFLIISHDLTPGLIIASQDLI